jgi:acetolactate synthase-1/2/3 large subunit
MKMTGGQIIVDYLIKEGVEYVFTVCGHGNTGLLDSLYERQNEIKTISVRHEQAAGHMADAYFRITHKPAATLTSCGPGSANLPVALGSAMMDSSAFLAITGNVPTSQFNRSPFQETGRHYQADYPSTIRPYVKRSFQPTRAEMLPTAMRQAFKLMMTGRTGPVNLDVPLNVFVDQADIEMPSPIDWRNGISRRSGTDAATAEKVIDTLYSAKKPLIIAGHGAALSGAEAEVLALAEQLNIPVVTTPNGAGIVDMRNRLVLGTVGRNGTYPATNASRNCDVLLALGVKFDDRLSGAWIPGFSFNIPPTRLIHIDIDPEEMARNYPPYIGILGDVKAVLQQLADSLATRRPAAGDRLAEWWNEIDSWEKMWEETIAPRCASDDLPIRPERLVSDIRKVFPEDGILLADVGVHHNWLVQQWKTYYPRTFLQSWGFASMGFGVCGVLGAKLAAPDKPCLCVCGDGGFMMTPHILCTAVEYDIPAVWVIWDNNGYCAIRDIQVGSFGGRELATSFIKEKDGSFYNPDFVQLANSCGVDAASVNRADDLAPAIEKAIKANKPYVISVKVDREIRPVGTGGWELQPLPPIMPNYGI